MKIRLHKRTISSHFNFLLSSDSSGKSLRCIRSHAFPNGVFSDHLCSITLTVLSIFTPIVTYHTYTLLRIQGNSPFLLCCVSVTNIPHSSTSITISLRCGVLYSQLTFPQSELGQKHWPVLLNLHSQHIVSYTDMLYQSHLHTSNNTTLSTIQTDTPLHFSTTAISILVYMPILPPLFLFLCTK